MIPKPRRGWTCPTCNAGGNHWRRPYCRICGSISYYYNIQLQRSGKETVISRKEKPTKIDLIMTTYQNRIYGAGCCTVYFAGVPITAVAIICKGKGKRPKLNQKYITTAEGACMKLLNWGMSVKKAHELVDRAQKAQADRDA